MREEMTTLGESCQFFNGKAHEKDIDAEGQFVVVNSKFISTDGEVKKFTAKQMFPLLEDDIVMVMSDVPNGKALAKCYVIEENDRYSLNQRICAIRTTEFNIRFLYYQLNRHPYLLAFNNGENQTNLRKGDILDCPLWKPTLEVQEQIVKILDEALDQIDQAKTNIEKNIANAKELFQSKLNDIFSQKGDGWEEKSLGEVCKTSAGGTPLKSHKEYYENGTIPWIRSGEVNNRNIQDSLLKITQQGLDNSSAKLFPPDTVVVAMYGATAGQVGILRFECSTNQAVCGIYPSKKYVPEFLYYFFLDFKEKLVAQAVGNAQPNISQMKIKDTLIPIITIDEQIKIVDNLDALNDEMETIESHYHQKLTNLEDLKKSILQKAFSGELSRKEMIPR